MISDIYATTAAINPRVLEGGYAKVKAKITRVEYTRDDGVATLSIVRTLDEEAAAAVETAIRDAIDAMDARAVMAQQRAQREWALRAQGDLAKGLRTDA